MPNEIWKDIEGFEGIYQISSLGRVKAIRFKPKIRVPHISKDGYVKITLCVNYKYTYYNVHRLVASAFVPTTNASGGVEVDHIDGNKLNNSFDNLRWVSHWDNMKNPHTVAALIGRSRPFLGRYGKDHPRSKPIYAINADGHRMDFEGSWDADRKGYKYNLVQKCLHDNTKTYLGYHWFYTNSSQKMGSPLVRQSTTKWSNAFESVPSGSSRKSLTPSASCWSVL